MNNGWDDSARAWITSMGQTGNWGQTGDWGRTSVLDPVMLERATQGSFANALDVGCGEGRFCRLLQKRGLKTIGIDPTRALIEEAIKRDPAGEYRIGRAESLPFESASFDLVISYLTLLDIDDARTAIEEMVRVLRPNGVLLAANLNSFFTANGAQGWIADEEGQLVHYPIDHYLEARQEWVEWDGIRVRNWHRPLSAYMTAFLDCGLILSYFAEPKPQSGESAAQARYTRAPWFWVMEWRKVEQP